MRSRIGSKSTALAVVALAATALAGGALAAIAAHSTATTATTVKVPEKNYTIGLSRARVPLGKVTFVVHNSSRTVHKFGVKGRNFTTRSIVGSINPGQTKSLTVTFKAKGKYTVFCALHASLGMKKTLYVGTTPVTTTTHTTTTSAWG